MKSKQQKLSAKEKRINEFKKDLDAFSDILYTKGYLPKCKYSAEKLYWVFKVVHDWLEWHKDEDKKIYRFDGIKKAILRDAEECRINPHEELSRKTFCGLLHLGDVTDKIIDGTYRLGMESSKPEEVEWLDSRYEYTSIVVQDSEGKQVGNHRWVEYRRPREDAMFSPHERFVNFF